MAVCKTCDMQFSCQKNLTRHRQTSCEQQNIQKCYVCNECDVKFVRKDSLIRHLQCRHMFGQKSLKCAMCPKTFVLQQRLTQHIKRSHTIQKKEEKRRREKEMVCTLCCKYFDSVDQLKLHNKTVHPKTRKPKGNIFFPDVHAFECHECHKTYSRKNNLVQHMKHTHLDGPNSYVCNHCERKYSKRCNLIRHIRTCTQTIDACNKNTLLREVKTYKCLICGQPFCNTYLINKHYEKIHSVVYVYEHLEFSSRTEFDDWMANGRKNYIQCFADCSWETGMEKARVFRCHRSGENRKKKIALKRTPKLVGSKKLDGFCPMSIILKESKTDGKCSVTYQKTHIGHSLQERDELPFISLNETEKLELASKISSEVPKDTIITLNEFSIAHEESHSQPHVLSYQDMSSIVTKIESNDHVPSACNDDSVNIYNFVISNHTSILFYKPYGELDKRFSTLAKDDFALAYMDNNQERALLLYGHKIVAFEGIPSTTPNDLILHSVSVQDTDFDAYPVAFLLTNRNDKTVINILIQHIKQRVGVVMPKAILSDMQHFYFDAWLEQMGPVPNKFYSSWHVRQSWKRNFAKISNKELRVTIKKDIEHLSEELDEDFFEEKLNNLIENENVELLNFLSYFCTYVRTKHYWAYCYRKNLRFNTNVCVQRFHRTLKQKTAGTSKIKSVSECLGFLQSYLTWKENGIKKKLIGGNFCHKSRALRKRHKAAEDACSTKEIFIEEFSPTCWHVQFLQDHNDDVVLVQEVYVVQKLDTKECSQYSNPAIGCSLACPKCKICHHEFVCICSDNSIRNYMCKHIHILGLYLLSKDVNHEHDFNEEKLICGNENFNQEEQMLIEVHDLNQGDGVHINEHLIVVENPVEGDVILENRKKNVLLKLQQYLEDAHSTEAIDEIEKILISPIKPLIEAKNE